MKRKRILLTSVILLLCLTLLCSCQEKEKFTIDALSDLNVRDDLGITLTLKPETLSPAGGEFTLYNDSDTHYYLGGNHCIEKKLQDGWHKLETDHEFVYSQIESQLYLVEPLALETHWSHSHGRLPAGEYRLVEEICYIEEAVKSFYVACEFTIK